MTCVPRRFAWAAECHCTGSPSKRISPSSGTYAPAITFMSVDLPAPFSLDERVDLARPHAERDGIEALHAGKAPRHVDDFYPVDDVLIAHFSPAA